MSDPKEIVGDMAAGAALLHRGIPETMKALGELGNVAYADGALPQKTKELLALAIAIATHCDGCIVHHARSLFRLGVTRAEVLETIGVSIQMGGGPSVVYGGQAIRAYDAFSAK